MRKSRTFPMIWKISPNPSFTKRGGFTLIELIVAISILTIGIVLVVRSFLTASSVLDRIQTRLLAVQLIAEKAVALEQSAKQDDGVQPSESEESVKLLNHDAVLKTKIVPIEVEELKEDLNEVHLSVSWGRMPLNDRPLWRFTWSRKNK